MVSSGISERSEAVPGHSADEHTPSIKADSSSANTSPSPGTTTSNAAQNVSNPFITNKKAGSSSQLKPLRRSSGTPEPSPAGLSASRNPFHIFHKHKDGDNDHGVKQKAKSFLHLKQSSTNHNHPVSQPHPAKTLKRANTSSKLNHKDEDKLTLANGACVLPSKKEKDKIKFNPYGNLDGPQVGQQNAAFYLEDSDVKNTLPLPIENPNDHLPADMQQKQVDLTDFYEIPEKSKAKMIGDGASSDVRVINEIGNKQKKYALKKLLLFKGETAEHFYKRVAAEFVIAKNVSNGFHIVTTAELLRVTTTGDMNRGWGITMEYCEGGDLFSLATNPAWRSVAREDKFCIFKQIAFGIKFLHEKDIAHIDLKPENVLLTKNGVVKLTDFGISRFAHKVVGDFDSEVNYITKPVGSAPYSPPEMLELEKNKNISVEPFKVDMWALGVLLSVLFYSNLPFREASNKDENYRKYLLSLTSFAAKYNPGMKTIGLGPGTDYKLAEKFQSKEASYMCWRLMDPSDTRRYTLEQLFCDPFFRKIKTCTDEFSHLSEPEDELCNHDHVFELKSQGYDSSVNNSSESLHRPIRSMLDIPAGAAAGASFSLSRSSSASSVSTTTSSMASMRIPSVQAESPVTNSPVRSMLDPLPARPSQNQPQQPPSSASLERRKSYDKNGKFNILRSASGSFSDSPPRLNGTTAVAQDAHQGQQEEEQQPQHQQSATSSELPPLKEEVTEKTGDESITVVGNNVEEKENINSTPSDSKNESVLSLTKQRVYRDTNVGDNDALQIDQDHGLIETHCLISDDTLKKCCCYDSRVRHKHAF